MNQKLITLKSFLKLKVHREIISKVSKDLKIPLYTVDKVVSLTFKQIKSLLVKEHNIMIRGYIKFVTSKRKYFQKPNKLRLKQIIKLPTKQ
jgi:nucleoid DNA-binding protein